MSRFLDGTCARRGPKRKCRTCLVCDEGTTDPAICTQHTSNSVFCAACVAGMWTQSGRRIPSCQTCGKKATDTFMKTSLQAHDTQSGTHLVDSYTGHRRFLDGDVELPIDGLEKRVCACHDPPCKGTVSADGNWIVFRPSMKVCNTAWSNDQRRYLDVGGVASHKPVCAHCLAPSSTKSVDHPCMSCMARGLQSTEFATLCHYISPNAGAKGQWGMPLRAHHVSHHDYQRHLYWILEDPDLFVRCPVDGTVLEHGVDCHELTCPTCKITKFCYCCGRAEVVGEEGAILDHFTTASLFTCPRYRDCAWNIKGGSPIECPCTQDCTNMEGRCDMSEHKPWRDLYQQFRRMRWLCAYLQEVPLPIKFHLILAAQSHHALGQNGFRMAFLTLFSKELSL